MKVYVVVDVMSTYCEEGYWQEYRNVHGVYTNKEAAENVKPSENYEYTDIEEFELDGE